MNEWILLRNKQKVKIIDHLRILANGLKIIRYPENIARYYMLGHAKDAPSTRRLVYMYIILIVYY